MEFVPGMQGCINIGKSISVINHSNRMIIYIIILIETEKRFDKNSTFIYAKTLNKIDVGTYFKAIKTIYEKPIANIIINGGN